MTDLSKAERLAAAMAEQKEAYRAYAEAARVWDEADRACVKVNYRIRAIEAEKKP